MVVLVSLTYRLLVAVLSRRRLHYPQDSPVA
jgi:hypothetical protein